MYINDLKLKRLLFHSVVCETTLLNDTPQSPLKLT